MQHSTIEHSGTPNRRSRSMPILSFKKNTSWWWNSKVEITKSLISVWSLISDRFWKQINSKNRFFLIWHAKTCRKVDWISDQWSTIDFEIREFAVIGFETDNFQKSNFLIRRPKTCHNRSSESQITNQWSIFLIERDIFR